MGRFLILLPIVTAAACLGSASAVAADAPAGGVYFKAHCAVCHSTAAKSAPGVGPRLLGVLGRPAGTLPGYTYSPAMKQSHLTWTPDALRNYLAHPQQVVKGSKMPFQGIPKVTDLDNVVAYLQSLY